MALLLKHFSSIPTLSMNFPRRLFHVCQVQQLYSPAALGIDKYINKRKQQRDQLTMDYDKFKNKMNVSVNDPKSPIFTEELKNLVHIADLPDLDLLLRIIRKFNSQKEMRFGSFSFGPVVMRLYHFLDAPNEALQCFEDPANEGFFDQITSIQILLDLLFRHAMYNEMFRVFDKVQERQINMTKYPKSSVVLIMAACYKQNTPESLQYASHLYSEMNKSGAEILRKSCALFAALALQQNAPQIAIEATGDQQTYVTIRNIKAMALAQLGRFDETITVLRSVVQDDKPGYGQKHTFCEDTILFIREAIEASNNIDVELEFSNVEEELRDRSLIENKNLNDLLLSEIQPFDPTRENTFSGPHQMRKMSFRHARRY